MRDLPVDRKGVGAWIGLSERAIREYEHRYAETDNPFPPADGKLGGSPYWMASRKGEILAWDRRRAGRGANGGRPAKAA